MSMARPQNRLASHYINIATTRYNELLGPSAQASPKEKRKKKKRKQCRDQRIDKNEDDPQPLRPPENSHHAPSTLKRRVPSKTSKKESDDNDAATRTNPRVSPGTLRGVGKRYTRRLQEGRATLASINASVLRRQGLLPTSKNSHLGRSVALRHSCHPLAHATTVLQSPSSPHRGPCCETSQTDKKEHLQGRQYTSMREESTSTAVGDSRPDVAAGQIRPILARQGLDQAHKAPLPHCSRHATVTATLTPRTCPSVRWGRRHRT
jgi:hypothetical protein